MSLVGQVLVVVVVVVRVASCHRDSCSRRRGGSSRFHHGLHLALVHQFLLILVLQGYCCAYVNIVTYIHALLALASRQSERHSHVLLP